MEAIYVRSSKGPGYEGKCWMLNGDIYYSPNSCAVPRVPGPNEETVTFIPGVSKAEEFANPRWWKADTEWLGFLPTQPVSYSGVWFDSLSHIPRAPTVTEKGSHSLFGPLLAIWLDAENVLLQVAEILNRQSHLRFTAPFSPRRWGYHLDHPTAQIAQHHILNGRNWFAIWLGLVFWMTRKVPEDGDFVEGVMPPNWFRQVIANHPKHAAMDAIRLSPLLQRMWNISRVGVWLHHPNDQESQPSAQWFVEQGVPVWYRWGRREAASATYRQSDFSLIAPSAAALQEATTTFTRPVEYTNDSTTFPFIPDTPASPQADFWDAPSPSSPPLNPIVDQRPKRTAELAYPFWEIHFKKVHTRHLKQLSNESAQNKQARISRQNNPPMVSAAVYEWEWNDEGEYVRQLQLKSEWVHTLAEYGGRQKRYDPFLNQWDCCEYWGPASEEDEEDVIEMPPPGEALPIPSIYKPTRRQPTAPEPLHQASPSPPIPPPDATDVAQPPPPCHPGSPSRPSTTSADSAVQKEVIDHLMILFGFVPPTPLPSSSPSPSSPSLSMEVELLISALALQKDHSADPFFHSPLGNLCLAFIQSFKNGKKPDNDMWDLAQDNRQTLYYSQRLNSIRTVQRKVAIADSVMLAPDAPRTETQVFYMFDFAGQATVQWHLAVLTAADALYVCRLPASWSEEELALDLVTKGIPFRTFQRRNTLAKAPAEKLVPILVPMRVSGYMFTADDFTFYLKQRESCFVQRRFRAALLRGGLIWRIAREHIGVGDAIAGPLGFHQRPEHMLVVCDVNGEEYVDDTMMDMELDVLCGLYLTFTGQALTVAKKSWFPTTWVFEHSGDYQGQWSPQNETAWRQRNAMIQQKPEKNGPLPAGAWRNKLRTAKQLRSVQKILETWSKEIIANHVGSV